MPFRRTQYGYRPRGYSNASSRGGHSNSDSNASAPSAFTYRGQRGRRAQRGRWSFGRRGSGFRRGSDRSRNDDSAQRSSYSASLTSARFESQRRPSLPVQGNTRNSSSSSNDDLNLQDTLRAILSRLDTLEGSASRAPGSRAVSSDHSNVNHSVRFQSDSPSNQLHQPSGNSDFRALVRSFFRFAQLAHHQENWSDCPSSIDNLIDELVKHIKPPLVTSEFNRQLSVISHEFKSGITALVQTHLQTQSDLIRQQTSALDGTDSARAREISLKQIARRLGKRMHRSVVNQALQEITYVCKASRPSVSHSLTASSSVVHPSATDWSVVPQLRHSSHLSSTHVVTSVAPPVPTSNRFQPLTGFLEDAESSSASTSGVAAVIQPPPLPPRRQLPLHWADRRSSSASDTARCPVGSSAPSSSFSLPSSTGFHLEPSPTFATVTSSASTVPVVSDRLLDARSATPLTCGSLPRETLPDGVSPTVDAAAATLVSFASRPVRRFELEPSSGHPRSLITTIPESSPSAHSSSSSSAEVIGSSVPVGSDPSCLSDARLLEFADSLFHLDAAAADQLRRQLNEPSGDQNLAPSPTPRISSSLQASQPQPSLTSSDRELSSVLDEFIGSPLPKADIRVHSASHKELWLIDALKPGMNTLLIADSNGASIAQARPPRGWTIDVFRGAQLSHVHNLLVSGASNLGNISVLIVAVGLNDRLLSEDVYVSALMDLQRFASHQRFKLVFANVPLISSLPAVEKCSVARINSFARDMFPDFAQVIDPEFIRLVPNDTSRLHFDVETAKIWIGNMKRFLAV